MHERVRAKTEVLMGHGFRSVGNSPLQIHVTVRRASASAPYRLWAEVDGDFGVALARSHTAAGLRRNAIRGIRRQWKLGYLEDGRVPHGAEACPQVIWHRSTRRYARVAGKDMAEIRRRWRESERRIRRIERGLRRAGAYAREARFIARGQVFLEVDLDHFRNGRPFEVAAWNP